MCNGASRVLGQENIPRDGNVLGNVRDPVQAERGGYRSFVGYSHVHDRTVHGRGYGQSAQRAVVLQHELLDQVVVDGTPIPESDRSPAEHVVGLGHGFPLGSLGGGSYRVEVHGQGGGFLDKEFHLLAAVGRAILGRGQRHGGKAAPDGCTRTAFERFGLLVQRFAETAGRIHPTGGYAQAFFIHYAPLPVFQGNIVGDFPDGFTREEQVFRLSVVRTGGVHDQGLSDKRIHRFSSRFFLRRKDSQ